MDRLRRASGAALIVLGVTCSLLGVLPHQTRAANAAVVAPLTCAWSHKISMFLPAHNFASQLVYPTQRFEIRLEQDPTTTLRITAFAPVITREQVRSITAGAEPVRATRSCRLTDSFNWHEPKPTTTPRFFQPPLAQTRCASRKTVCTRYKFLLCETVNQFPN